LSVFVPDEFAVTGYGGNWTKEFSYNKKVSGNSKHLFAFHSVQSKALELYGEFGVQRDDFQIAGNEYPFTAIHPDNDTALTISIVNARFSSIVFIVMVLYGLLTIKIPLVKWIRITLAIIVVCVFIGFIATTLTEYLAANSAVCWGVWIILLCRLVKGLFSLRKKNCKAAKTSTEATTETPSETQPELETIHEPNDNIVTNNQEGGQNNEN
jgi:hypothetical protein